ncbi:hypothetical protein M378DRAFT_160343 [Amanita muscaria Koide BX008]|uniref:Uncharacterized protein n=1 Tax=Amanita muscaria (strain Koide BX008) TaxID=946122 RepID=A0A0C2STX2_AMAMK|nr:hypothetical protein M378DRAFT_160343 [Amanita muscaria Koide BX008]
MNRNIAKIINPSSGLGPEGEKKPAAVTPNASTPEHGPSLSQISQQIYFDPLRFPSSTPPLSIPITDSCSALTPPLRSPLLSWRIRKILDSLTCSLALPCD